MKNSKFVLNFDNKELTSYYLWTPQAIEGGLKKLIASTATTLGLDIETGKTCDSAYAGLDPYRSTLSLIQFYDPTTQEVYLLDWYGVTGSAGLTDTEQCHKLLKELLRAKRVIAHNALFDYSHLAHKGYANNSTKFDCSMILYNLVSCAEGEEVDEEGDSQRWDWLSKQERRGASLRAITAKLLDIKVDKDLQKSDWTKRPLDKEQIVYATLDSYLTYTCGKILATKVNEYKLQKVYQLNKDCMYPVVAMMLKGWTIDTAAHTEHCVEWQKLSDSYHTEILKLMGSDISIASSVQLANWLEKNLPLTVQHKWPRSEKTNRLQADAKALSAHPELPFTKPLLEYKYLEKMLSTYGMNLIDMINPVTNRLHGGYTLAYTATGRMSSRSPNIQNLPREEAIRGIFIAAPGHTLVGADYSQIEVRVAAEISRDPELLNIYQRGLDVYSYTAAKILKKPIDDITKQERQIGKSLVLGLLYGLGAKGLIEYSQWNYGVTLTMEQAKSYYKGFFTTYSGYAQWQIERRNECLKNGYTSTVLGKRRALHPDKSYTRSVNHPVQGSAAEVVLTALKKSFKAMPKSKASPMAVVHDEIIYEVKDSFVEKAKELLKDSMEEAMLEIFPRATLKKLVDVKSGKSWMELK